MNGSARVGKREGRREMGSAIRDLEAEAPPKEMMNGLISGKTSCTELKAEFLKLPSQCGQKERE